MKNELKPLLRELLKEELQEMYPMHPDDEREMGGDGYSNEFQRQHAADSINQPRKNETKKAEELAKRGKYVLMHNFTVYSKNTDAIIGDSTVIIKVFGDKYQADTELAKMGEPDSDSNYYLISPETMAAKNQPAAPAQSDAGDDVPFEEGKLNEHNLEVSDEPPEEKDDKEFDLKDIGQKPHPSDYNEGYGMGDMAKDPKKAFKGSRWTVKYNEQISLQEVNKIIRELIKEESRFLREEDLMGYNPEVVASMRDWVKECLPWRDIETEEEVDELPIDQLVKGINANYDGGFSAFLRDSEPVQKMRENTSGWNPKPLPQDANQIASLIHNLTEGTGIFFCYDNQTGHSADWIHVSCVVNGDYYTYRVESNATEKKELESEEEIAEIAQEIATGGYHYYSIEPIQGYKKSLPEPDDQDDVDYSPDRQEPQFESNGRNLYEAKGSTAKEKVRSIIREVVKEYRIKK